MKKTEQRHTLIKKYSRQTYFKQTHLTPEISWKFETPQGTQVTSDRVKQITENNLTEAIVNFNNHFCKIMCTSRIPKEWRTSIVIPLFAKGGNRSSFPRSGRYQPTHLFEDWWNLFGCLQFRVCVSSPYPLFTPDKFLRLFLPLIHWPRTDFRIRSYPCAATQTKDSRCTWHYNSADCDDLQEFFSSFHGVQYATQNHLSYLPRNNKSHSERSFRVPFRQVVTNVLTFKRLQWFQTRKN